MFMEYRVFQFKMRLTADIQGAASDGQRGFQRLGHRPGCQILDSALKSHSSKLLASRTHILKSQECDHFASFVVASA